MGKERAPASPAIGMSIRSIVAAVAVLAGLVGETRAASLQQLSTTEMIRSATAIVRATVTGSSASQTGSTIYTHYKLQVSENLKGQSPAQVDVPGGQANGLRQAFPGVPELKQGTEYVLFIWTSSTGINHILGFSQGVFSAAAQTDGSVHIARARIAETMHDKLGNLVQDQPVATTLSQLRTQVQSVLASGVTR